MHVLVTGAAGFIGSALCKALLDRGDRVVGVDNLNAYYDPRLKEARLALHERREGFTFLRADVSERGAMADLFSTHRFDGVVHLAAQAGVRYSIENPAAYVDSNLLGFGNILEGARHSKIGHLVYASSSSVYGMSPQLPYSESHNVDHPVSIYAATKKANELMAHSYSHLFGIPTTGLRFFTVYGPWGRPDMALFKFTKLILEGQRIPVFNHGQLSRDFTYIDDVVAGVVKVLDRAPAGSASGVSSAPYRIYNIGNSAPIALMDFIRALELALGIKADLELLPMQPGDVLATFADVSALERDFGFSPSTPISEGVKRFVDWYRMYYNDGSGAPAASPQ